MTQFDNIFTDEVAFATTADVLYNGTDDEWWFLTLGRQIISFFQNIDMSIAKITRTLIESTAFL